MSMKEERTHFQIRVAAVKRLLMLHLLKEKLGIILVSEFPKSGGTWLASMLSSYFDIPFPRNESPKLERCLFLGHFMYHKNFGKIIGLVRDGRDVVISFYFHTLFSNDANPNFMVDKVRQKLRFNDYENVSENLPSFIEYLASDFSRGFMRFSWADSVKSFKNNKSVQIIQYENLLTDPNQELKKAIAFLTSSNTFEENKLERVIDEYSFQNQTKRKPGTGDKNQFIRKGISGDWKNYFNKDSAEIFDKYWGQELIDMGYEEDRNWVLNCN